MGTEANQEQRRKPEPLPSPWRWKQGDLHRIENGSPHTLYPPSLIPASVVCDWDRQRSSQEPAAKTRGGNGRKEWNN